MISGTAYGVVLNDRMQLDQLGEALSEKPYLAPPAAPVVHIKPRTCFSGRGAPVPVPIGVDELVLSATIGLMFARDCAGGDDGTQAIGAACLALDVSEPEADYFRPAIRQRCRDGFLPLGTFGAWAPEMEAVAIATAVDGVAVHEWSLSRLARPVSRLIADLTGFMTLRAGDLLMVGLPGDAPRARAGQQIAVSAPGLATLRTCLEEDA